MFFTITLFIIYTDLALLKLGKVIIIFKVGNNNAKEVIYSKIISIKE